MGFREVTQGSYSFPNTSQSHLYTVQSREQEDRMKALIVIHACNRVAYLCDGYNPFLDVFSHIYKRVCPSVGPSFH